MILVENSRLLEYVDEVLQQQLVVDADQQRRASNIVIYQRQTDQPPTDLAVSMKLINHSPVYRHVNDENTGACISRYKLPTCLVSSCLSSVILDRRVDRRIMDHPSPTQFCFPPFSLLFLESFLSTLNHVILGLPLFLFPGRTVPISL